MNLQLTNKHILVTGASSGMGRIFAQMIAAEGAIVTLLARNEGRLIQTLNSLHGDGHKYIVCDLTDEKQLRNCISSLASLDGVVFCAGINDFIPVKFIKQEKIDQIFQTNYFSEVILTQLLLKKKLINKHASLVYISSLSSQLGIPGTLLYSSSKAAINSAVKVIASELAPQGIRANSICPGIVKTELLESTNIDQEVFLKQQVDYPLGLGTPEDVGNVVLFYLSEASKWITGSNLVIDGGFSLK